MINVEEKFEKLAHYYIPKTQKVPICAIYALINGLYAGTDLYQTPHKFKVLTKKLWKLAVKDETIPGQNINTSDINYSLVGEFFDSQELLDFIIDNKDDINKQLEGYKITGAKSLAFTTKASTELTITRLRTASLNELYLIPINVSSSKSKNNMYWLSFRRLRDGRLAIFNSNKKAEEIALKNAHIDHYNGETVIEYLGELALVYREMQDFDKEHDRVFDFQKWAKRKHSNV